ncbi:MAG: hypothetical protein AAGD18_02155 [Actinomycetota bacterium]
MSTTQLHLIDGGASDGDRRHRGDDASGSSTPSWRLDADTIARGRRGIAEARAVLATRRPLIDEVPAA